MTKKQDGSIGGWLIVWIIATIILIIGNLAVNYDNWTSWLLIISLLINLIMVISAKGTRWLMFVTGILFGTLYLGITLTTTPTSICTTYYSACVALGPDRQAVVSALVQRMVITGAILTAYMYLSSLYFAFSKRLKARFGK